MDPNVPSTKNPFSTFALNPQGVQFETQEEGEAIVLLLRAHLVTLVPAVITIFILLILPVLVLTILNIFR
ncbi:hypothetical protein HY024_00610, partial [Candidatus Curtissbacteria bacterium]|nr:hypothetical protein [Candidatus Curtissbacteria bacterium]